MLSYDKGSNLLTLEKVHNPSLGEHLLLLKDLRESFDKFINEGVYEALESINEIMETEDSHYKKLIFKPTLVEGFGSDDPLTNACEPFYYSADIEYEKED